jgi:hypothetical protein
MTILTLIARLRPRTRVRRSAATAGPLSIREWADLPTYHPLRPN